MRRGMVAATIAWVLIGGSAGGGARAATERPEPVSGRSSVTSAVEVTSWAVQWGLPGDVPVPADYVGDSRTDLAVWRPLTGTWWIRGQRPVEWGREGDRPVPADYDGDGKAEIAIYRDGVWFVRGIGTFVWGQPGDQPVPADYLGDRRAEFAVTRSTIHIPETFTWHVRGALPIVWGAGSRLDRRVPADYIGDSYADIAVMRPGPTDGTPSVWYVRGAEPIAWGRSVGVEPWADAPVPANFIGDRKTDIAVWRLTGEWFIRGLDRAIRWGRPQEAGNLNDAPALGDYGGDSHTDIAVWRHATGTWYIRVESPLR